METVISIFNQLFWAIIGAFFGLWLPFIFHWWKYNRRPELLGDWKSAYQGIDEIAGTWVSENVHVDVAKGKFRLKNSSSSHGYNYTAWGNAVAKTHLVGDWESIRPGANAYGAFILTISPQGDSMYGYWVGPDKTQARRYGRWVLARDDEGLEKTKNLIEQLSQPNPFA